MVHRFFLSDASRGNALLLDGTEAHHLMNVLRVLPGESVEVFDGQGCVVDCEVESMTRRDVKLRVRSRRTEAAPIRQVMLGTAVPKGDRFDWLIEKATELGVTCIVPLTTARSSVDPRDGKLDKLRQTVIAACKQSGRNHLMEIRPVTSFADVVRSEVSLRNAYLAHPASSSCDSVPIDADPIDNDSLVFLVGPEGGFTDDEVELAVSFGVKPICLGPNILRIETAAIALAVLGMTLKPSAVRFV